MPTFMQKIRLALRGWSRRREERDREFVAKSASWSVPGAAPPPAGKAPGGAAATQRKIDIDGLAVAYLDDSGRIAYYLDVETGDVMDVRDGVSLEAGRYKRIPTASHDRDRDAFLASMKDPAARTRLQNAHSFRASLAEDRALERGWFNFRNDRALAAIDAWLRGLNLR